MKELFLKLIKDGKILPTEDITLLLNIDQQGFATNGLYGLGDGIKEELRHGIQNFNYGIFFEPILSGNFLVVTKACVSASDYLIQASDILANRTWRSHKSNDPSLRNFRKHIFLILP